MVVNGISINLCSWLEEVVYEFASMAKSQRGISHLFHPIDKDERLLNAEIPTV